MASDPDSFPLHFFSSSFMALPLVFHVFVVDAEELSVPSRLNWNCTKKMAERIMRAISDVSRLAMMRSKVDRFRNGWCSGNRSVRDGDRDGNRRLFSPPRMGRIPVRDGMVAVVVDLTVTSDCRYESGGRRESRQVTTSHSRRSKPGQSQDPV